MKNEIELVKKSNILAKNITKTHVLSPIWYKNGQKYQAGTCVYGLKNDQIYLKTTEVELKSIITEIQHK